MAQCCAYIQPSLGVQIVCLGYFCIPKNVHKKKSDNFKNNDIMICRMTQLDTQNNTQIMSPFLQYLARLTYFNFHALGVVYRDLQLKVSLRQLSSMTNGVVLLSEMDFSNL